MTCGTAKTHTNIVSNVAYIRRIVAGSGTRALQTRVHCSCCFVRISARIPLAFSRVGVLAYSVLNELIISEADIAFGSACCSFRRVPCFGNA